RDSAGFRMFAVSSDPSFVFQAEDGIRYDLVTGVQTCALPISGRKRMTACTTVLANAPWLTWRTSSGSMFVFNSSILGLQTSLREIGRASCRERDMFLVSPAALIK